MKVWLDGRVVDEADATVSVFDHGLTVGDGVFETAKVVDGVPFALSRHLDRLVVSARGLGLAAPAPDVVRPPSTRRSWSTATTWAGRCGCGSR